MKEKIGYDFDLLCKKFGVDKSRLSRDYGIVPLRCITGCKSRGLSEIICKQDLQYLFLQLNLSTIEIGQLFGFNKRLIEKKWLKHYCIKKSKEQIQVKREKTNLQRIGYKTPIETPKSKLNNRLKIKELYGEKGFLGNKECRKRIQYTMTEQDILKIKQTKIKKYGKDYLKLERAKGKETYKKRTGYATPFSNPIARAKADETKLKRYGSKYYNNWDLCKQTNLRKYGKECYTQTEEWRIRHITTKKKNHTFGTSKPEERGHKRLLQKFKEVKRQYRSDKYPFACDFYIPQEDLYIECNYFFTHGEEPFDVNKTKHLDLLKQWEFKQNNLEWESGREFYKNAIETWTKRDPLKFKTAQENKLNYKVFYNENEFNKWIEEQ